MDKAKAFFLHSMTVFVARVGAAISAGTYLVDQLADIFNQPQVHAQLAAILDTRTVALIGLGSMIVVELARRRTLPKEP